MPTIKLSEKAYTSLLTTAKAIVEYADAVKAQDLAARTAARGRIAPQTGLDDLKTAATVMAAVPHQFGTPKTTTTTGGNHGQGGDIQIVYTKEEEDSMAAIVTSTATSPAHASDYNVHIHLHLPKAPV